MSFIGPLPRTQDHHCILRGDLIGTDLIVIGRIAICSPAPIETACKALLKFGFDPATPLKCHRGGALVTTVTIGMPAVLEAAE
jgi:hypothetical protein